MIVAEDIRRAIIRVAEEGGDNRSFSAIEIARQLDPVSWPEQLDQVLLVADSLIREGKIKPVQEDSPEIRFTKI